MDAGAETLVGTPEDDQDASVGGIREYRPKVLLVATTQTSKCRSLRKAISMGIYLQTL